MKDHQKSKANDDTLSQHSGVRVSEIMKILGNQLTWNLSVLRFSERENYAQKGRYRELDRVARCPVSILIYLSTEHLDIASRSSV